MSDKYDRKFALRMFFDEIITLSHTRGMLVEGITGGGYPLSGLTNDDLKKRRLVKRIAGATDSDSHEFRLNGAGLKLYWRLDQEHDLLKISIGGDQAKDYPFFTAHVRNILKWNALR